MKNIVSENNINTIMAELAELIDMQEELKIEIERLQDQIKAYMTENSLDELLGNNGEKATWRSVLSSRFDSSSFKKDFLDIYKAYTKQTEYRRFTFNK